MLHRPMKKQFILSFALALGLAAFGLTFNVEKNIRYSDAAARCVLDVKWPAGVTNFATVVNFHGGGLVKGSKHFARWPDEAADKDPVAFVGANYRLLKDEKTGETATPEECISDSAAAVAWQTVSPQAMIAASFPLLSFTALPGVKAVPSG